MGDWVGFSKLQNAHKFFPLPATSSLKHSFGAFATKMHTLSPSTLLISHVYSCTPKSIQFTCFQLIQNHVKDF